METHDPKTWRKQRVLRKLRRRGLPLLLVALVVGGLAGGLYYVNRVILPTKIQGWAEALGLQTLGRRITIGSVQAHLLQGIVLKDITVEEDARYGRQPFLQVDELSAPILSFKLLKERRFLIPSVKIVGFHLTLIQDSHGLWNFGSLRTTQIPKAAKPVKGRVLVPLVNLVDGQIQIVRRGSPLPVTLDFQKLKGQASFTQPEKIQWSVTGELASSAPIHWKVEGTYDFREGDLKLASQTEIPLKAALGFLPPKGAQAIDSLNGTGLLDLEASGKTEGPFGLKGFFQTKGLEWKIRHPLRSVAGQESLEWLQGQGDLQITLSGPFAPHESVPPWKHLQGGVHFDPMTVGPLPLLGELRQLTGHLKISADKVETDTLTANLPTGQTLQMGGSLLNDGSRTFAFTVKTNAPLGHLVSLHPKLKAITQKTKLTGLVHLEAAAEGPLKPSFSIRPTVTATVENASLEWPGLDPLKEVVGTLRWQPDLVTVTELKGRFQNQPFRLQGSLVNFNEPEVDAQLTWGRLTTEIQFTIQGETIDIQTASGHYAEGSFHLFGEITSLKDPMGNLYGETSLPLEEMPSLFPRLPAWGREGNLKGPLSIRWLLKGPLKRPTEWDLDLKANSPSLTVRGIPLEQPTLWIHQEAGRVTLHSGKAGLAGGTVSVTGSWQQDDSQHPWRGQWTAESIELSSLADYFNWNTPDLSGKLSAHWEGGAQGFQPMSVEGKGSLQVRGGRILELPFLGPFADLIKIPTLQTITFQEAEGPFTVSKGALRTQAFQMKAPQVTLTIVGSGGFVQGVNSPIDWRIFPTLAPELVPPESRSKVGKAIAKGTSYLVGEIRLSGTWKNRKRTFVSKPVTQVLNEQLFNLQDLFQDIF